MKKLAVAVAMLLATGVAVVVAPEGSASATVCAARSANFIGGTISGQDGRAINAQISLNGVDAAGHSIDANGCRTGGYTANLWVNMNVSGDGSTATTGVTRSWMYRGLPSNVVAVWIEVWIRTNTPKPCPTCDGPLDVHRYGFINRRAVKVNSTLHLLAPLHCGLGGTTGNIQGALRDAAGHPVVFDSIYAWSMLSPDGSKPLQGWGVATQRLGYYVIDTLASGQSYTVWATYHGVTQKRYYIPVKSCTSLPLPFTG